MKFWSLCFASIVNFALAKNIQTNSILFKNAPPWLTESVLESSTNAIQNVLEWDIRRIKAFYHSDLKEFDLATNVNFTAEAYFQKKDATIHLSPRVNKDNFSRVFGHELVHAIFFQKYTGSIPAWLEEGLANFIGKKSTVDYAWLTQQPTVDVTTLAHPNTDASGSRFHYAASTALIEMIQSKCSLKDLLQLSVGKKLTTYLKTYCEIDDINASFKEWLQKKRPKPKAKPG